MDETASARRPVLRRTIVQREVVFRALPPPPVVANGLRPDTDTQTVCLNFAAGVDLPKGAKRVNEMSAAAQNVLSVFLNGAAWLEGTKRWGQNGNGGGPSVTPVRGTRPEVHEDLPLKFNVEVDLEAIPTATAPYHCVGYRMHLSARPPQVTETERQLEIILGYQPLGDVGGDDEAPAPPPRRPSHAEVEKARKLRDRIAALKASPWAHALGCSFMEAKHLRGHAESVRARSKKTVPDPWNVIGYRFSKFTTPQQFLHEGVQPFFDLPGGDYDEKEAFLAEDDPRSDFLDYRYGNPDPPSMEKPDSILSPTLVFSKERAMVYKTRGSDADWHPAHCTLKNYIAGAPDDAPLDEEDGDADESGGEGRDDDAMDIDDAPGGGHRLPRRRPVRVQSLRSLLEPHAPYHPIIADVPRMDCPHPRLRWHVNKLAVMSEMLMTFEFPFAIGEELPPGAMDTPEMIDTATVKPVFRTLVPNDVLLQMEAVEHLYHVEQTQNGRRSTLTTGAATGSGLPPLVRDSGDLLNLRHVTHVDTMLIQGVEPAVVSLAEAERRYQVQNTPRHTPAPPPPVPTVRPPETPATAAGGTTPRHQQRQQRPPRPTQYDEHILALLPDQAMRALYIQQVKVVSSAMYELNQRFRKRHYDEFSVEGHRFCSLVSAHDVMGVEDFSDRGTDPKEGQSASMLLKQLTEDVKASGGRYTAEMVQRVMDRVEIIPEVFSQRNDFLAMRSKNQTKRGFLEERHKDTLAQVDQLLEQAAASASEEELADMTKRRNALAREQRNDRCGFGLRLWEEHMHMLASTTNAPPALLAARNFALKHIPSFNATTASAKSSSAAATTTAVAASTTTAADSSNRVPSIADHPDMARDYTLHSMVDGRRVTKMWRFFQDTYVNINPVSAQNLPYLTRAHMCSFGAHRYAVGRSLPAPNYLMAGASGAGKSYILNYIGSLMPEGVFQNTTSTTTNAQNVDVDADHEAVIYEEMDSDLLFSNRNTNDTGATNKINFAKARLTAFFTVTQYFFQDEETGQRQARRCYSSQNVVILAGTNQKLDQMDENMVSLSLML